MNQNSRRWLGRVCVGLSVAAALTATVGCTHTSKNLIFEKTVTLKNGRFVGPVELDMPEFSGSENRWVEIHSELSARCTPRLRMSYPDGESDHLGKRDVLWQELLGSRANAGTKTGDDEAVQPDPAEPAAPAGPGVAEPGHWQRSVVESWPGQIRFQQERDLRCAQAKTYRRVHHTAVAGDGRLAFWAEVPQELADGQLTIRVFEVVDGDGERRAERRAEAAVQAEIKRQNRPPKERKPIPPKPAPKSEKPGSAKVVGATWSPGSWSYSGRKGKWVWVRGHWLAPATRPALRAETPGAPPVAGCTWASGSWVWVRGDGSWKWTPGHWNAPPPRVEARGTPPVPESVWVVGRWLRRGKGFRWQPGYWGRPALRVETIPPPPNKDAQWISGRWYQVNGKWVWAPGFYDGGRKPPARKKETPPARPQVGAIWLAGYWQWVATDGKFDWIAGHWELPPGEDYVWVPDPIDPVAGVSIGGEWKLKVKLVPRGGRR